MDDLRDMKAMWIELNNRITSLEESNRQLARQVMNKDFKSAKNKLIQKYRFFLTFELIWIIISTLFIVFDSSQNLNEKYRWVTLIYWNLFFLVEAGIDFYLMIKIRQIDIYNSSVSQIAKEAAHNWKIHKVAIILGIPIAIGAIILFALMVNANKFTIFGMFIGGMIGALIGSLQLKKFLEYYKLLQQDNE